MDRIKECQDRTIKELEDIPSMTDRELIESIAEKLAIMELRNIVDKS